MAPEVRYILAVLLITLVARDGRQLSIIADRRLSSSRSHIASVPPFEAVRLPAVDTRYPLLVLTELPQGVSRVLKVLSTVQLRGGEGQ